MQNTSGGYLPSSQFFSDRFSKPSVYSVTDHKPFVLIVYAQNTIDTCEKNLRSIFEQEYDNFRVIYLDDGSSDGTMHCVKEFTQKNEKEKIVTFIRSEKSRGMMAFLFDVVHSVRDEEIVVLIEGKDWGYLIMAFFRH